MPRLPDVARHRLAILATDTRSAHPLHIIVAKLRHLLGKIHYPALSSLNALVPSQVLPAAVSRRLRALVLLQKLLLNQALVLLAQSLTLFFPDHLCFVSEHVGAFFNFIFSLVFLHLEPLF